jgi:hypothetical protein
VSLLNALNALFVGWIFAHPFYSSMIALFVFTSSLNSHPDRRCCGRGIRPHRPGCPLGSGDSPQWSDLSRNDGPGGPPPGL